MPPTSTQLIGLSGYAQVGKDTAAKALVAEGWERRAFADKLREVAYGANPWVRHNGVFKKLRLLVDAIGWERAKNQSEDVRDFLQDLGTDGGRRALGYNVWVDAAMRCLPVMTVFTDVRFPNEADAIRNRGGLVVRVTRPGVGPKLRADGTPHESEVALDDYNFDHVICNDGGETNVGRITLALTRLHAVAA
jgi:hypothetical protein